MSKRPQCSPDPADVTAKKNNSVVQMGEVVTIFRDFLISNEARNIFKDIFSELFTPFSQNLCDLQSETDALKEQVAKLNDKVMKMEEVQEENDQNQRKANML